MPSINTGTFEPGTRAVWDSLTRTSICTGEVAEVHVAGLGPVDDTTPWRLGSLLGCMRR